MHYLDNRIYTDPAIFALEREQIFAKCWKFLCHESEIGNRGDYRTATLAGIPLIVLRDAEETVRAYYNICPHRGAALLGESAGSIENDRIQCFYHLWSFDTAGRCVNIPEAAAYRMIAATPELGAVQTWLAFDREEMTRHFAAIPEHRWPLGEMTRIVSVDAIAVEDGKAATVATFCILRNDDEGRTTCYAVGRYRDRWRMGGSDWRIAERVVDLRTRLLPAPAPIPL